MSWKRIRVKFLVGILFSAIAIAVYSYVTYGSGFVDYVILAPKEILSEFVLFFLLGYIVIGNSFAPPDDRRN
ncbi:hypothetical protein [Ochrovirga pacifica]|uniref:hypothetical protein n=1 Tax=Ochrovirga pacifica TaxID=1042376 RepID=UPI0002558AE5|nr:hypothetical protein [Ochrovirga pacifica]